MNENELNDATCRRFIHQELGIKRTPVKHGLHIEDATLDFQRNYQQFAKDEASGILSKDIFQFGASVRMQFNNKRGTDQREDKFYQQLLNDDVMNLRFRRGVPKRRYEFRNQIRMGSNKFELKIEESPLRCRQFQQIVKNTSLMKVGPVV